MEKEFVYNRVASLRNAIHNFKLGSNIPTHSTNGIKVFLAVPIKSSLPILFAAIIKPAQTHQHAIIEDGV